jgi:hypothetical protein
MKRKLMVGTIAAAAALMGATAMAAPAVVATGPDGIVISIAPPQPRYEVVPAAREGHIWVPGHYEWRNGRYDWMAGHWVRERPGYRWEEARWVQRPDGNWYLTGGDWRRGPYGDRDRDGVANRYDNDRDGDGIANRYDNNRRNRFGPNADLDRDGVANRNDRDIDGDGVSNRNDDFPYDRQRS